MKSIKSDQILGLIILIVFNVLISLSYRNHNIIIFFFQIILSSFWQLLIRINLFKNSLLCFSNYWFHLYASIRLLLLLIICYLAFLSSVLRVLICSVITARGLLIISNKRRLTYIDKDFTSSKTYGSKLNSINPLDDEYAKTPTLKQPALFKPTPLIQINDPMSNNFKAHQNPLKQVI